MNNGSLISFKAFSFTNSPLLLLVDILRLRYKEKEYKIFQNHKQKNLIIFSNFFFSTNESLVYSKRILYWFSMNCLDFHNDKETNKDLWSNTWEYYTTIYDHPHYGPYFGDVILVIPEKETKRISVGQTTIVVLMNAILKRSLFVNTSSPNQIMLFIIWEFRSSYLLVS